MIADYGEDDEQEMDEKSGSALSYVCMCDAGSACAGQSSDGKQ